ncbi:unnamed protein product [Parascedosporium putredinis]|uniref:Uncharacterized protein n=1 Tax=Parascedosporium putredinis TaxID=1442378 RepID=A0A9P1HED6_9PEZI|nr:unnamed protein product [Parascedosporium putredinis]CAI8004912.1 unnamed protein product [Parascedosporium putredinis]
MALRDSVSSSSTPNGHGDGYFSMRPQAAATAQRQTSTQPAPPGKLAAHAAAAGQVDESEWAAFEADIAAATVPYSEDAIISADAVPANGADDAEREDATRALEEEFDEMSELEARARRLKEKREALRLRSASQLSSVTEPEVAKPPSGAGKENQDSSRKPTSDEDGDDDDDDDDDYDEDDYAWGGLRYAGRA